MIPQIQKETPPFVRFEFMEYGIDEEASKTSGARVPKVIPFALIMQHGSKDCVEKPADEWLAQISSKAIDGQYPAEWVSRYKMQYEAFLKGNELPREGTPVKTCAIFNREQAIRLVAIGITTVEDLGNVPDQGLGGIGLDGRYLRDLARNYLAEGKGVAAQAKKVADLEQLTRDQAETIERMNARMQELESAVGKRKAA